ncbi:MAG: AMP-binding protein [Candidatus Micrarchaeota archaeon]
MGLPFFLRVLGRLKSLKDEQRLDRDRLLSVQEARLTSILRSAKAAPHYRSLGPFHSLAEFPLLSKEDIRRSPDAFLGESGTNPFGRTTTSGTTGAPLEVRICENAAIDALASRLCFLTDFGLAPFDRFAEIVASVERERLHNYGIASNLRLPLFSDEAKNLALLRRYRANALRATPSVSEVLASLNAESPRPLRLKFINCGGETLTDGMRRHIEESFSSKVFMTYGLTELGFVAWECPEERRLHVNSSSAILEIVDEKGRPKRSGAGEIVATTLANHAMPLIRYRTGDYGSWGECGCGRASPVIKSLEGRSADIVELPGGKLRSALAFYFPQKMKHGFSGIRQYQVVQERPDRFVFRYVPLGKGPSQECLGEIKEKILTAGNGEVSVELEETDRIPREKSGKFRHMVPYRGN